MTCSQSMFLLYPGQVISEVWNQFTALNRRGKKEQDSELCAHVPLSLWNKSVSTTFQEMKSDSCETMKKSNLQTCFGSWHELTILQISKYNYFGNKICMYICVV